MTAHHVDPVVTLYVATVLSAEPARARRIAACLGIPRTQARAALRQLQTAGLATSHGRRWTTPGGDR